MEAAAASFGLIQLLLLIAGVMALLTPFFVFRIRSESIKTNEKLNELIRLVRMAQGVPGEISYNSQGKEVRRCPSCNAKNRIMDLHCISCGAMMASGSLSNSAEGDQLKRENPQPEAVGKRVLCEDGNCIGILGVNGKCKTCGRSPDEIKYGKSSQ